MKPAFVLSKWYADVVTGDGGAAIVYSAQLEWRALRIHYSNLLEFRAGCTPANRYSLRRQAAPAERGESVEWSSRALGASGRWRRAVAAREITLYECEAGRLEWRCLAPRAEAEVRTATLRSGWGYVEHLRLTVPPWRLPIRTSCAARRGHRATGCSAHRSPSEPISSWV